MAKRKLSDHDSSEKTLKKRHRNQRRHKDRSESIKAHRTSSSTSTPTPAYQFVPNVRQSCDENHNLDSTESLLRARMQHQRPDIPKQHTASQTKEKVMSRQVKPQPEASAFLISTPVDLQSTAEFAKARQASQQRTANLAKQFSNRVFSSSSSSSSASPSDTTSSSTSCSSSTDSSSDAESTADDNFVSRPTLTATGDGTSKQKDNKRTDRTMNRRNEKKKIEMNAKKESQSTIPNISYPALEAKYKPNTPAAAQARADFKAVQDSLKKLESVIPPHILAHATASITQTRKKPKKTEADNLSVPPPHHSEVVLRAAHHLILQLSFQKLLGPQQKDPGINRNNGGTSISNSTIHRLSLASKGVEGVSEMELELVRIAREREQQILGLKAQFTALKDVVAALKKGE